MLPTIHTTNYRDNLFLGPFLGPFPAHAVSTAHTNRPDVFQDLWVVMRESQVGSHGNGKCASFFTTYIVDALLLPKCFSKTNAPLGCEVCVCVCVCV